MNGPESDENFRHTTPMTHRKFGALRDVHDVRDRIYRAFRTRGQSCNTLTCGNEEGRSKDQGRDDEGSCTGHVFSSAREWIARMCEKTSPILSPQLVLRALIFGWCTRAEFGSNCVTACGARRFSHDVSFCRLAHRFLILLPISGI
jgi:hypothetical protein